MYDCKDSSDEIDCMALTHTPGAVIAGAASGSSIAVVIMLCIVCCCCLSTKAYNKINCRCCVTRRQADPGANRDLINDVVLPAQSSPSTTHSSASSASQPESNGATDESRFSMNRAPPGYTESAQFPLFDVASLPAYDVVCDSLPAYDEDEL
eukprot:Em0001g1644a